MNSIVAEEQDGVPTGEANPDEPIARADRIVALDFIRGIAVLGIVFANVVAFAYPTLVYFWPAGYAGGATGLDRAVWLFQLVFVEPNTEKSRLAAEVSLILPYSRSLAEESGDATLVRSNRRATSRFQPAWPFLS